MGQDITDEEWEELYVPCENNHDNFIIRYIIPEVFAFQLYNSYSRGCLCNATLLQHYKSMTDIINLFPSIDQVIVEVEKLLNIKYNLRIVSDNPLVLDKWQ